jgi:hypothetical protein
MQLRVIGGRCTVELLFEQSRQVDGAHVNGFRQSVDIDMIGAGDFVDPSHHLNDRESMFCLTCRLMQIFLIAPKKMG